MEWVILMLLLVPTQDVRVDLDSGRQAAGRFQAVLQVLPEGGARGRLALHHQHPEDPRTVIRVTVEFLEAEIEETADGVILRFGGLGEVRDGRGGGPVRGDIFGQVGPWMPTGDDPVWQFHGPGVYSGARLTAFTRLLGVPMQPARP
jgi:hypothetical protein